MTVAAPPAPPAAITVIGEAATAAAPRQTTPLSEPTPNIAVIPQVNNPAVPGWRARMRDKGFSFVLSYASESATVLGGGREGGSAYTQQLLASAIVDTDKAFGLKGGKFVATIIDRKGVDLTATRIGNLFEVQELYGGGQDLRPAEITYEQKLDRTHTGLKFGLYHTGDDFATLTSACNFQSFAFCPRPTTLFYNSGFSGFPIPRWGFRVRQQLAPNIFLTAAVFEVNTVRAQTGNGWKLGPRFDSAVVPVELSWKVDQKPGGLPGLVRVGGLIDTTDKPDQYEDANGDSYVLSKLAPALRTERWSAWAMAEKMVARFGKGDRGLTLFGDLTLADRATSRVPFFVSGGVVAKGLFESRPKDGFGFGLVYAGVNPRITYRERDQVALGKAVAVQTYEASGELFYAWQATSRVLIRPNLQYIHRVGATSAYPDATVGGCTIRIIA